MIPLDPQVLFDSTAFDAALEQGAAPLPLFRTALRHAATVLDQRFLHRAPIGQLVRGRAWVTDQLLGRAWQQILGARSATAALVAVGGYGRGELHPHSDVDLMVLLPPGELEALHQSLECFLLFLWDMGMEVGHSVRTVDDCVREAEADITVATNLMEARLLVGDAGLYYAMRRVTGPDRLWPGREFFEAKWQEQIGRHRKFHDTAYNLEPNIKEGPGGLRDIQMIGWVAKRHFNAQTLEDLVGHGFLTPAEYKALIEGQNFLWQARFGLHMLAKRREDRLLFDHQRKLAGLFGYKDTAHHLAVEQFMKRYYRTVKELGQLNEMLLQLFQEQILFAADPGEPVAINRRFQARKGFLEVTHDSVFQRYPFALLEVFLLLAQHGALKGIRAATIRLIRSHLHLIDDAFRADLRCRTLFMELLRQPVGVYHGLQRMNRYGLLGAYLPVFGRVVGQMQHDLFHVYTVDEHTLFVLRNIRSFRDQAVREELPSCAEVFDQLPKPELLYVTALFHDIAKGRGGDHSELGAADVADFCRQHQLSDYDSHLITWLVRNHLLMSTTAQRKDINDPEVVLEFASRVVDRLHLDYLYLLTVADIRATSPTLWNSWKGALLYNLYQSTRHALRRGLANPMDIDELIADTKQEARTLLRDRAVTHEAIDAFWARLYDDYFLRYSADEIAWHTESILSGIAAAPLILIRQETRRGGTEVFIYTPWRADLFALTTGIIDQMGLTIADARILPSNDGYTLDTYIVLEENGSPITNGHRVQELYESLHDLLAHPDRPPPRVERRLPRQLKHFPLQTRVQFEQDLRNERTIVEVVTSDRPGLLSQIAKALMQCEVYLQNAKIATLGARVEDIFFVTDEDGKPVADAAQLERLRGAIVQLLDG